MWLHELLTFELNGQLQAPTTVGGEAGWGTWSRSVRCGALNDIFHL